MSVFLHQIAEFSDNLYGTTIFLTRFLYILSRTETKRSTKSSNRLYTFCANAMPVGDLGLYKSRPDGLGSFAKPQELPRGYLHLELINVLETHINLSCSLRCLMKVTGICNKINIKFDSYSLISVLSYLLSQKRKSIDFINFNLPHVSLFLLSFFSVLFSILFILKIYYRGTIQF